MGNNTIINYNYGSTINGRLTPPPPKKPSCGCSPSVFCNGMDCNNGGTNMYDVMVAREQRKAAEDSNEKGLWATIANGVGNFFSSGCGLGSILGGITGNNAGNNANANANANGNNNGGLLGGLVGGLLGNGGITSLIGSIL